jgi:biopolymer transport protein ExbD
MARRSQEEVGLNMTPMIDIVFQLIIFFVVTTELDRQSFNERIILAFSPHGPAIEKRDPRTVTVEVDDKGRITIGSTRLTDEALVGMLKQAVAYGGATTPVQIRGDRNARHDAIRRVMEACGRAGLWRVSFVATKEKGKKGS